MYVYVYIYIYVRFTCMSAGFATPAGSSPSLCVPFRAFQAFDEVDEAKMLQAAPWLRSHISDTRAFLWGPWFLCTYVHMYICTWISMVFFGLLPRTRNLRVSFLCWKGGFWRRKVWNQMSSPVPGDLWGILGISFQLLVDARRRPLFGPQMLQWSVWPFWNRNRMLRLHRLPFLDKPRTENYSRLELVRVECTLW